MKRDDGKLKTLTAPTPRPHLGPAIENILIYQCSDARVAWRTKSPPGTSLGHSGLRPQPSGDTACDLRRRLVGHREHRANIDLAQHVAVGPVGAARAEH